MDTQLKPPAPWYAMASAPKDGTMVRLLVDYTDGCHALEDASIAPTIGHNNDGNVGPGEGEGWQFAGWNWEQDCFTQGVGTPIGWLPLDLAEPTIDAQLRAALIEAREVIKSWHGPVAWEIYDEFSPEMKRINGAIAKGSA